jgi:SrtB family sortase
VIDSLPFGLEIDEDSITRGGDYDSKDEEIRWKIDVPAGKTVSMTYRAAIPEDAEDGESYTNRAYIPSVDSARVTVYVTEGGVVPKTGITDATVFPAAWWMGGKETPPAAAAGDAEETAAVSGEPPEPNADFAGDYARNGDLVGWLVAGRTISQPVFQLDNQYYMTHDAQGNESANGAVFLDEHNQVWPRDVNLIVYGHNMKSDAMFGTLDDYRTLGYLKDHPVITFQTVYDETPVSYVPFAVFDASMSPGSAGYVKIRRIGFGSAEENAAYLKELKSASLFDIPVDVQAGDQLLTLVTCSYSHEDGRFVVVARRVREGETLDGLTGQVVTADKKV